jgi:hypothetical protein
MRFFFINTFTGYPQAEKHAQNLKLLKNYNYKVSSGQECEIPHIWAAILNFTHFSGSSPKTILRNFFFLKIDI